MYATEDIGRLVALRSGRPRVVATRMRTPLGILFLRDSAIVSGLVFLALRVYAGRSAAEILATEPTFVADIGLSKHLSPTRSNGLSALLARIRDTAQAALDAA